MCQHKIKFVLTFSGNDQTLVEICTVALHFGSDICQHKIKFVLTFSGNDQTPVEICTVALHFGSDICQIKLGFVQVNPKNPQKMSDVRLLFRALYCNVRFFTSFFNRRACAPLKNHLL